MRSIRWWAPSTSTTGPGLNGVACLGVVEDPVDHGVGVVDHTATCASHGLRAGLVRAGTAQIVHAYLQLVQDFLCGGSGRLAAP